MKRLLYIIGLLFFLSPSYAFAALVNGNATLTSQSKTQAVVAVSNASGGTPAYTYQWYRSQTANFTPGGGNIIGGATSQSLTDTPPSGGLWFYENVVTDSTTSTAGSNQLGVYLNTGTDISLCAIGDSIFSGYLNNGGSNTNTNGIDPITFAASALKGYANIRNVTFKNNAYAGTYTSSWLPTAGAGCGGGSSCLSAALTACAALSSPATIMVMEMGANDTNTSNFIPAATILSNVSTIANYVIAQGYSKVILFQSAYAYPGAYTNTWTAQSAAILATYNASIPTLDNGTTIRYSGDNVYGWSIDNCFNSTFYNNDNVHPNQLGDIYIGANIAGAITNLVDFKPNIGRMIGG